MRTRRTRLAVVLLALAASAGCAHSLHFRDPLASSLEFVPESDRAYAAADPAGATGKPGEGKVTRPYVVRLTADAKVYRLWAGPDVRDALGRTSRIGQWWTFEAPAGTLASFRRRYEVCEKWDTLRWVASCDLQVYIKDAWNRADLVCPDEKQDYLNDPRDIGARLPP